MEDIFAGQSTWWYSCAIWCTPALKLCWLIIKWNDWHCKLFVCRQKDKYQHYCYSSVDLFLFLWKIFRDFQIKLLLFSQTAQGQNSWLNVLLRTVYGDHICTTNTHFNVWVCASQLCIALLSLLTLLMLFVNNKRGFSRRLTCQTKSVRIFV